jgi:hypothetical protein
MTVRPRRFVRSLRYATVKTMGSVRDAPIAERALAWTRVKPRALIGQLSARRRNRMGGQGCADMIILGVYVVKGLHVAKTHAVEMKWAQRR